MKNTFLLFLILVFNNSSFLKAQEGFQFANTSKKKQRVNFQLINNLIVIPLVVNNKKLTFILDSGVRRTILFNVGTKDSLHLANAKKVKIRGLGDGEPMAAFLSSNNSIEIKNIKSTSETMYIVLNSYFDFSSKMGITIHGVIGYDLLKNFILKINYVTKIITFYNAETYQYKKCRKCEIFPLQFYRNKPFINAQVQLDTVGNSLTDVKLLIDSGGSDSIWLFEDSKENIKTPNLFYKDILGEGLSGTIFGNRSRIPKVKLKSFDLKEPTVSFLDEVSTHNARSFKERNGSIGAGILSRFTVWLDYPNKKLTLKKNSSFKKPFHYNMSGLDIIHNGKLLVRENVNNFADSYNQKIDDSNSVNFINNFSYNFKPSFIIKNVVENSVAAKAGLLKNDVILKINHKPAHELTLNEINLKFRKGDGKKIKITISRDGKKLDFQFRLKRKI